MATVSVLLLLLSAFSPPVHSRRSTFQIIPSGMTQTEARAACRENYIDLVTVYSDEDNTDLNNMTTYWNWRWIGLYRSVFSEKWSNADPVTFRNLAGDCGTSSRCAAMKADGSWESLQCTGTRYFMCYEEDVSSQTPNYHLILENKTWSGAQRYCRGNYTDLVSIRDQQQNEEVKIKGLNSTTSFWIGLLCDDWQWTDGGNSAYRNWAWGSGQPWESPYDCVVSSEWGWNSVSCSDNYVPLCYSTFSPPVHSRLTTFQIIPSGMTQTAARAACRENYIDLVTVYSDEDYTDLYNMKPYGYWSWIGLYRSNFSEKWSNADPVTFRNLTGDCGTSSRCAAMKTDGSWESLQCTGTRYFMCYEDVSSQTPNYHLILESETWSGAQRYCRGKYTDLVSIRDQQQNEEVKIKGLNSTTSFWIGLLCDDWQWTDGGNSAYRNWAKWSGQPQPSPYDCVILSEWGWYSIPCNNNYPPLCYSISIHVSDEALSWEEALDYCREGNRAGILNIDSESEQEELESELRRRRVPPGNLWVGLGPNRLSEMKVSSGPLTCEDVERQTEPPLSHCAADTHAAEAAPDYVMNSAELRVVCKLK